MIVRHVPRDDLTGQRNPRRIHFDMISTEDNWHTRFVLERISTLGDSNHRRVVAEKMTTLDECTPVDMYSRHINIHYTILLLSRFY